MGEINPGEQYGYIPTLWICALFITLYGLSTLVHVFQAFRFRMWWIFPTIVLAGFGEILGWSGRLWSSKTFLGNAQNPFLIQISCTIIAPTPLLAANFIILGRLIKRLGPHYSRLSPRWYAIIFTSIDVIALAVQAFGGATASSADTDSGAQTGANIMLAGIIIQLVSIIIYSFIATEFLVHYNRDRPFRAETSPRGIRDKKMNWMVTGLRISTICLFIRSIYRTIELADGWTGSVLRTQWPFNVFDGAMVVIAFYTINLLHPGYLVPEQPIDEKTTFISQVDIPLTKPASPAASDV